MRNPKVILILLVLIVGGFVIKTLNDKNAATLRVAFPGGSIVTDYDPASIHRAHEYLFLENIYSPLVEVDPAGGPLLPGIAESYAWVGNEIHLKIRSDLRTQNGTPITVSDAVFSLKRLLVLTGNTHGNLRDILCPDLELKSVSDDCPGIDHSGSTLILRPGSRKAFLLPMLAGIDFAIIPRSSVDPQSLKIVNFQETSGPYFVLNQDADGKIELAANAFHYHFSGEIPQKVSLIPMNMKMPNAALNAFKNREVDHLMNVNGSEVPDLLTYANENPAVNAHATMKIRSVLLVFTEKGQTDFSRAQRRFIGHKIKDAFRNVYGGKVGYEEASVFFHSLADGGLSKEQYSQFEKINLDEQPVVDKTLRLGILKADTHEWVKEIKAKVSSASIYFEKNIPDLHVYQNREEIPHAFIVNTDSGFSEDISLISYSLSAGTLGLNKEERSRWLSTYMATDNKDDRMKLLRSIHFDALAAPIIVPLFVSPFVALAHSPWKIQLSDLYANNQLWLIKHD